MQAWASCSGGWTSACDPQALGGGQFGEQRGADLEHSTTTTKQGDPLSTLLLNSPLQLVTKHCLKSGTETTTESDLPNFSNLRFAPDILLTSAH